MSEAEENDSITQASRGDLSMDVTPRITIEFDKPTYGFWDGGARSGGTFEPDILRSTDKSICWGCWELNFYFSTARGETDKQSLGYARRWLKRHCKVPFKFVNYWSLH